MCLLIESIKLKDGKFHNLSFHRERMRRSISALFKGTEPIDPEQIVKEQDFPRAGLHKCRIIYGPDSFTVSFTPYHARQIRRIRLVEDNDISYSFKFADRGSINRLFDLRGDCDDVLIVKHGKVTDCSYSNVLFRKGVHWFTPDSPLLEGTMRAKLIGENKIRVREIRKDDIRSFDGLKIINAMLEFDGPEIEVSDIVF